MSTICKALRIDSRLAYSVFRTVETNLKTVDSQNPKVITIRRGTIRYPGRKRINPMLLKLNPWRQFKDIRMHLRKKKNVLLENTVYKNFISKAFIYNYQLLINGR